MDNIALIKNMEIDKSHKIDLESSKMLLEELESRPVSNLKNEYNPELVEEMLNHYKMKQELKNVTTISKLMFLECLKNHPDTWPSLTDADRDLKKSSSNLREIKNDIENEKTKIEGLADTASEAFSLLEVDRQELEVKLHSIDKKRCQFEELKQKFEKAGKKSELKEKQRHLDVRIAKLNEARTFVETQLKTINDMLNQQESRSDMVFQAIHQVEQEQQVLDHYLSQSIWVYKDIEGIMEKLGGIKEHPLGSNKIKLEFLDPSGNNLQLFLTLIFAEDKKLRSKLTNAEISGSSVTADDLIGAALKNNDIPMLITKLKQRWLSFLPLLSVINEVMESHAVDWIQEKGLLRVLLGKQAVMCTLQIPPGYPLKGEIMLTDMQGTLTDHSVTTVKPPDPKCTLKDWLLYLEEWINSRDSP